MYTLRTITNQRTLETRKNYYLGEGYHVYFNVPLNEGESIKEGEHLFEEIANLYFSEATIPKDLIGMVESSSGELYPFFKKDAVYIVNMDGKTIERVYGQYQPN